MLMLPGDWRILRELCSGKHVLLRRVERLAAELARRAEEDPGLRAELEDATRSMCASRQDIELLAGMLEGFSRILDDEWGFVAVAWAALIRVILAACAPGWERLSPEERARVLAPAYMALCHLKLYEDTRRAFHAEVAKTLALLALARSSTALRDPV